MRCMIIEKGHCNMHGYCKRVWLREKEYFLLGVEFLQILRQGDSAALKDVKRCNNSSAAIKSRQLCNLSPSASKGKNFLRLLLCITTYLKLGVNGEWASEARRA